MSRSAGGSRQEVGSSTQPSSQGREEEAGGSLSIVELKEQQRLAQEEQEDLLLDQKEKQDLLDEIRGELVQVEDDLVRSQQQKIAFCSKERNKVLSLVYSRTVAPTDCMRFLRITERL